MVSAVASVMPVSPVERQMYQNALPVNVSAPPLPVITSAPASPISVSAVEVPRIVAATFPSILTFSKLCSDNSIPSAQ